MFARSGYFAVLVLIFLAASCGVREDRVEAGSKLPLPVPDQTLSTEGTAYEDVSFIHNRSVFGNFKRRIVPEQRLKEPDHKPDFVAPRHVEFVFDPGRDERSTIIEVYPVDGFPRVYAVNEEWVKRTKEEIAALKTALTDTNHRFEGEIPHLPYADASQDTIAGVRHVPFKNGKGILFVMSWSHGFELVSNHRLLYRYEGLTDDGRYYVTAEMPIRIGFLPEDGGTEDGNGYTWNQLVSDSRTNSERVKKYYADITDRLERARDADFRPALHHFEAMVRSIRVGKH